MDSEFRIVQLFVAYPTNQEVVFVHLASTFEKAIEWIKKYGHNFHEDEALKMYFSVCSIVLDKNFEQEPYEYFARVDLFGNIIDSRP